MTRQRPSILSASVVAGALVLGACGGGVDRDGTRDQFIEDGREVGVEIDGDCVDDVLDRYSDDQLEQADADPDGDLAFEIGSALTTCIVGG